MAVLTDHSDRAVSITVTYAVALVITTIVVAALLTAGSGFLTGQREEVVRDGFRDVGHTFASDLETADRLNRSMDPNASVTLDSRLPRRIADRSYTIVVRNETTRVSDGRTRYELQLSTREPRVNHTIVFNASSDIDGGAVSGGTVRIQSTDNGSLEVLNINASA